MSSPTTARQGIGTTLSVVDDLLSYMSPGKGKPSKKERAIFAAAVVFSYGVWESYVEELAIEIATQVSSAIDPSRVPKHVREALEGSSSWQLSVHPGWRSLWVQQVRVTAKGEGDKFGLNTAKAKQVSSLLKATGIEDVFKSLPKTIIPPHLTGQAVTVATAVDELVKLRSEIVHSGSVPTTLLKNHAREWRQFVESLTDEFDSVCRQEAAKLLI